MTLYDICMCESLLQPRSVSNAVTSHTCINLRESLIWLLFLCSDDIEVTLLMYLTWIILQLITIYYAAKSGSLSPLLEVLAVIGPKFVSLKILGSKSSRSDFMS